MLDLVRRVWSNTTSLIRKLWAIQILRFFAVGGVNLAFGYAAFAIFILFGLPKELAAFFSTICGILFNFKTTGTIVFRNKNNRLIFRFFGVYLFTYLLNIGLLEVFEYFGVGPLVAGAIIILPVSLLGFFVNKRFVFNTLDNTKKRES
jgi:putative flippase GtrA